VADAMGRLTTHVLDTARGCPGAGITVELYALGAAERRFVATATTDADGRCPRPLLKDGAFAVGIYELVFHAGDYFRDAGIDLPDPPFLDRVVIRFGIAAPDQHYHVPLLLSPYGYGTYRGS
jgi:5-hydroxyisourate hydrolase